MARENEAIPVSTPLGIHELELALIRELAAWRDWDLARAGEELRLMKRICDRTHWQEEFTPLVAILLEKIKYAEKTVRDKDTTLIGAAHTNLEAAVFKLRDRLYR